MKIRYNIMPLFVLFSLIQSIRCNGATYVTMQLITNNNASVTYVSLSTLNSIQQNALSLNNKKIDLCVQENLVRKQSGQEHNQWFALSPQGLTFQYSRGLISTYNTRIGNITDITLKRELQEAHAAFQKHLEMIDTSVGSLTNITLSSDILKNNAYSAAVRIMYKEIRKLAMVLGIVLPDPDASFVSSCIKWGIPTLLLAGSAYFLHSNWGHLSTAIGTRTEQCGTGIVSFGKGISQTGSGVQIIGGGIKDVGTWIKDSKIPTVPAAPISSQGISVSIPNP